MDPFSAVFVHSYTFVAFASGLILLNPSTPPSLKSRQVASRMRLSGRPTAWGCPDGLSALYGLPARRLAPWHLRPCPRRCRPLCAGPRCLA
jgi:hypothetical protein